MLDVIEVGIMKDTLMAHAIGANLATNARNLSHNSIQGHYHSVFGEVRHADKRTLRWAMGVGCLMDPNSPAARYAKGQYNRRPILGAGMLLGGKESFLVIPDLHMPYHHGDAFDFLYELNQIHKFDHILNAGDLYDHHSGSYHESETDALNPEDEYSAAIKAAHDLQEIFPRMVITNGNHDKIPQRKLKTVGLPVSMLSDYNKLYDTEDTWKFVDEYWFDSKGSYPVTHPMVLNKRGRWDGDIMVAA